MKTIIALINNPKESGFFVAYALRMAGKFESRLHILHVENPQPYPLGASNLTGQAYKQFQAGMLDRSRKAKKILTEQVERLMNQDPVQVSVEVSSDIGKDSVVLNKIAEDSNEYMVILENQESGSPWFSNENARSIALSVSCPVWIFPESYHFKSFDRIVYATDYNKEDISVLKSLIRTMRPFEPQLTALHITEDMDFNEKVKQKGFQEMLMDQTSYERIHVETLIEKEGEDLGSVIHHYCDTIHADLLVILKENRNFFKKIFTKSPAEKILKQVELPVLIYNLK